MGDFVDDRTFGQAVADVLGLPSDKLVLGVKIESEDGAMTLRASFILAPGDIERIGQRVKDLQKDNTST